MFNDSFIVDIETALKRRADGALLVDVRTALEFNEASIPGAVNVPILNDAERVEIGTLYKEQGSDIARIRGVELVAPKIPQLIQTINSLRTNQRRPIIIFCWRGGLRSRAMTAFLQLAGFPAFQLRGGHKAFRRHVVDFFDHGDWGRMMVLRGLTGVGKTRVLQQLSQQNHPVIDLEGLANHRGSAFGGVGLGQQPGQKQFESLLWDALQSVPKGSWALTEGESRHIGKIILPARFFQSLQTERTLWLETDFGKRIQIILEDYTVSELAEETFIQPIQSLQRRLGITEVENMLELLRQKNWHELVSELMLKYYDPLYCHTKPDNRITVEIDPFNDDHTELLAAAKTILATEPAA
ncbi:MAG: tRNA 2-selenouridine(34) synthase MnmH [Desulfuromonadales bacterium C00003068]|nr:MAG: tRNA 2-selenouridine(34) synthase MnmH [Desulfuromonadales bacterium C00003068]